MLFTIKLKEFLQSYEINYALIHKTKNIVVLNFDLNYSDSVIRFLNLENANYILHKYGVYLINLKANNLRHHQSPDFFVTHKLY